MSGFVTGVVMIDRTSSAVLSWLPMMQVWLDLEVLSDSVVVDDGVAGFVCCIPQPCLR